MKALKNAIAEFFVVGALGVVLGYTVNGLRASDSIKLTRNYFATGGAGMAPATAGPQGGVTAQPEVTSEASRPAHPYQRISFDEVVKVFNDPATAAGAAVFVDARNDQAFANGHIPGAIQADHYRIEDYIEPVLAAAQTADKVIVYCNGGDCEDSIYLCKDLIDFDVPFDIIYLYEGGWNEWDSKGQPVERSDE